MKLEKRKILDIQEDVPKEVKRFFFDYCKDFNVGNDVWFEYMVDEEKSNLLDEWLLNNTNAKDGEEILIKHWW